MRKENKQAIFFLLPMIIIMIGLVFYPITKTFFYSLKQYKLTDSSNIKFIGFDNYIEILNSKAFHEAVINTLLVIVVVLVVGFVFSIIVALMLNVKSKISGFLTAIAIIPWALPPIVNGQMWKFVFYPGYGLINKILIKLDVITEPIKWFHSRFGTLIIIGIIVAWRVIPFSAILILANMQSIPKTVYEAASIDGASDVQVFRNITFPMIMPSLFVVLTNLTMTSINVFDEIVALVGYRSMGQTLLIYNYTETFSFLNFGFGSAITYIIMIGSGIFGYLYIRGMSKGGI